MGYIPDSHAIAIGIPFLKRMGSVDTIRAVISHEWGHAFQQHKIRNFFKKI